MNFGLDERERAFLEELRTYLDGLESTAEIGSRPELHAESRAQRAAFFRRLNDDGWLGVGWPPEYGGRGRTSIEQWLYLEEMAWRRLPNRTPSLTAVAPTLLQVGTEEQKQVYLPGILNGEIEFALGYSEPNAGSDLASLKTRARLDNGSYVIDGSKLWTTSAHFATHLWLAVRTGPETPKHAGISLLIVPMDVGGITIQPIETQADIRTNAVFFDDVQVDASNLVGAENEGWKIITTALNFERFFLYSDQARDFDDLVTWCASDHGDGQPLIEDDGVRIELAKLAVDLEIARLLCMRAAWMIGDGRVPHAEASMVKVWTSEMRQRIANAALNILGEAGQLRRGTPGAPSNGTFEWLYRFATMPKFAGGTNEIQRNIIAQRGLGLPREARR